jgi:hypothetical protein
MRRLQLFLIASIVFVSSGLQPVPPGRASAFEPPAATSARLVVFESFMRKT